MQILIRETAVKIDWVNFPVQWGPMDLQSRIGTASFVYESIANPSVVFVPKEGDDVIFLGDDGNTILFFGHIAQVDRGGDPVGRRLAISCQDLNYLFDKILLPGDFVYAAGLNDRSIVEDLLFRDTGNVWGDLHNRPWYTIGIDTPSAGVQGGSRALGLPAVTLKAGSSLTQALNQISSLVGGVPWYLGYGVDGTFDSPRLFHWNDAGALAPYVLTTSPAAWPDAANFFYSYQEFIDRTSHYHRVRADNGAGLTAIADDWPAFADQRVVQLRERGWADGVSGRSTFTDRGERFLEGPRVSDSTLTTQAQVTRRAYQELIRGRVKRTITLTYDRAVFLYNAPIRPGMLVDVVHTTWRDADVQNDLNNPGFEVNPGGWVLGVVGTGTGGFSTDFAHSGTFSLKQTNPSAGNYAAAFQSVGIPLAGVATMSAIQVAVWAKSNPGAGTSGPLRVTFANPGANVSADGIASAQPSAQAGTTTVDLNMALTTAWTRFSESVPVPVGYQFAFIEIYSNGNGAAANVYWDDLELTRGVTPAPTISREVGTHSNIRGELCPGSRGRYLVQKVTPRLKAKPNPADPPPQGALYSYDLVLGDYEDSLETTLAKVI